MDGDDNNDVDSLGVDDGVDVDNGHVVSVRSPSNDSGFAAGSGSFRSLDDNEEFFNFEQVGGPDNVPPIFHVSFYRSHTYLVNNLEF